LSYTGNLNFSEQATFYLMQLCHAIPVAIILSPCIVSNGSSIKLVLQALLNKLALPPVI